MNIDSKRKELRKEYFETGGLIVVSVLGIIGVLLIRLSGIFKVENTNMLYDCISKNGMLIIFGAFFFLVSLYCWMGFFRNIILPPKKEILFLQKFDDGEAFFLNKKGKGFYYIVDQNSFEENSYYYVLKTHDYIYEVLEKTNADWKTEKKESYWLNFYSPMGNFKNIFLLPIVYVISLPGLLSVIMSKGFQKIYGLLFCAFPLYIIIYDLVYKIKLKQSNGKEIDDTKLIKSSEILKSIILIASVSFMIVILLLIFLSLSDTTSKLIFLPFLFCGLCSFGFVISKVFKNPQLEKLLYKGYVIIFLTFLFGFLIFWTVGIVKQEGNYVYALFSIPFWIAGIYVFYKLVIKDK